MLVCWVALSSHSLTHTHTYTHECQTFMRVCIHYASETSFVPDEIDTFVGKWSQISCGLDSKVTVGCRVTEKFTSRGDAFHCPEIFIARRYHLVPLLFSVAAIAWVAMAIGFRGASVKDTHQQGLGRVVRYHATTLDGAFGVMASSVRAYPRHQISYRCRAPRETPERNNPSSTHTIASHLRSQSNRSRYNDAQHFHRSR